MSGGVMLRPGHECRPPAEAATGARWQCDCERVWKCVVNPTRWSDGSIAFGAQWARGWWDLLPKMGGR